MEQTESVEPRPSGSEDKSSHGLLHSRNGKRGLHDSVLRSPFEKCNHIIDAAAVEDVHALRRLVGIVRRQHDLFAAEQGMARRRRLGLEYIDTRAVEMAAMKRVGQG